MKIVTDGTPYGTKFLNDKGEPLLELMNCAKGVKFHYTVGRLPEVELVLSHQPFEAEGKDPSMLLQIKAQLTKALEEVDALLMPKPKRKMRI